MLVLAPAVLSAVLAWSGVAKLRAGGPARRQAMLDLGVPRPLRWSIVADLHPWAELGLALALLVARPPWLLVPALLVVLLMIVYLALVVRALSSTESATCACFGAEGTPITARTVARNLLLLALAAVTVADAAAGRGFARRLSAQGAEGWAWLVGVGVVVAVVALVLPRGQGEGAELQDDLADPEMERRPVDPDLVVYDERAQPHRLGDLTRERALLLVFGSPGCAACSATYREMAHYDGILSGIEVRYVVAGDPVPLTHPSDDFPVWFDPQNTVARAIGAPPSSPCSVLVGADGLTAGEAVGTAQVRAHVGSLAIQLAPTDAR